jgi:1,4-dihydroxy-2-naphthoate octaprenyltransferase
MNIHPFHIFIKLSRPHFLLIPLGQAILGTGIAHYLGHKINWELFSLGLGWLFSLQLGLHYLIQHFDQSPPRRNNLPKVFSFYDGLLGEEVDQLPRRVALGASAGMLTITTIFTLGMVQFNGFSPSLVVVMGVILLISLSLALPVVNLAGSGLIELSIAFLIGILTPGFSFLLQAGNAHRFVILASMPLVIILIPVLLSLEFPNYAIDLKYKNQNLLQQLGWESAMSVQTTFLLVAFLILGLNILFGMPLRAVISPFLALPLALLQIWQIRRIAAGAKPNWKTLTWNAVVIFELASYMLAISFWFG